MASISAAVALNVLLAPVGPAFAAAVPAAQESFVSRIAVGKLADGSRIVLSFNGCPNGSVASLFTRTWFQWGPGPGFWDYWVDAPQGPNYYGNGSNPSGACPDLSLSYNRQNQPEIFVVNQAGTDVQHAYVTAVQQHVGPNNNAPVWSAFSSLGTPPAGVRGDVAVGLNPVGNEELFVVDKNGELYHNFATPGRGTGWNGWQPMDVPPNGIGTDIHEGTNYLGNQELYALDDSRLLWHRYATPGQGSGWSAWSPMSQLPTGVGFDSDVSVGINYQGNQEVYAIGHDGNIYHSFSTPGRGDGWSGFYSLGDPEPAGLDRRLGVEVVSTDYRTLDNQSIFVWAADHGTRFTRGQMPGVGVGWSDWTLQ